MGLFKRKKRKHYEYGLHSIDQTGNEKKHIYKWWTVNDDGDVEWTNITTPSGVGLPKHHTKGKLPKSYYTNVENPKYEKQANSPAFKKFMKERKKRT
tara:strand:- start:1036 stop:1326 length:291 start_codon:yes stop_codon:yes gene_type:complete